MKQIDGEEILTVGEKVVEGIQVVTEPAFGLKPLGKRLKDAVLFKPQTVEGEYVGRVNGRHNQRSLMRRKDW